MFEYRVVVFGEPQGPWRSDRNRARLDAIQLELGGYDEWGRFFITVPAEIQLRLARREAA